MNQKLVAYWSQTRSLWASFSLAKKITLITTTLTLIALGLGFTAWQNHVSYAYLFTDLSQEDAASVVAKLDELKIPHRLEANGTAVQVPQDSVHKVRVQLAGAGLPRGGGVGFELFDKSQFGATEFEQQVSFRRALEGELSRTISTIESVHSARVHLVLPEKSVFLLRNKEGSASVVLRLNPGRSFGRREVGAVVHLVASAVPGLTPNRISVVNSEGVTLHQATSDESGGGDSNSLNEREAELATTLEARARQILERVVGVGKADIKVRVELDSSKRERTEERYNPQTTALRSEHRVREGSPPAEPAEGVPGTRTNVPDTEEATTPPEGAEAPAPTEETNKGTFREATTRNWEVDKVKETTSTPAGGIRRLSIAVVVDGNVSGPPGAEQYSARTPEEMLQLTTLVKGAVGFDDKRGDTLSVESARFIPSPEQSAPQTSVATATPKWMSRNILLGVGAFVALAIVASAGFAIRRHRRQGEQRNAQTTGQPSLPDSNLADVHALPGPQATDGTALTKIDPRLSDPDVLREEAIQFALRDPATAAVILREWLSGPSALRSDAQKGDA